MKQTAVEWLVEQLKENNMLTFDEWTEIIEQAQAMEEEQICDAFYYGVDVDSFNVKSPYKAAEQYYNETFKSE